MNLKNLIKEAKIFQKKAYCPYSHFKVGAALLTKQGKIFGGFNIENPSFGATMCAERVALYNAYANGTKQKDIVALAIITSTKSVAKPCGLCLQVMSELLPTNAKIILLDDKGKIKECVIDDLLPIRFVEKDLKS